MDSPAIDPAALSSFLARMNLTDRTALDTLLAQTDFTVPDPNVLALLGLPADLPQAEVDALYGVWDTAHGTG